MKKGKCEQNHWFIKEGQLYLTTPEEEQKDIVKSVIKVLEKEIRMRIYDDICNWKPLDNRTSIIKIAGSIDNALLGVQAICADIALGNKSDELDKLLEGNK